MSALIWCPFPDRPSARESIHTLLREGLIGCGNILGECESHFVWQGTLDSAEEVPVLMKTDGDKLSAATARLEQLHPYEAPAILGWRADAVGASCEAWLRELAPLSD